MARRHSGGMEVSVGAPGVGLFGAMIMFFTLDSLK